MVTDWPNDKQLTELQLDFMTLFRQAVPRQNGSQNRSDLPKPRPSERLQKSSLWLLRERYIKSREMFQVFTFIHACIANYWLICSGQLWDGMAWHGMVCTQAGRKKRSKSKTPRGIVSQRPLTQFWHPTPSGADASSQQSSFPLPACQPSRGGPLDSPLALSSTVANYRAVPKREDSIPGSRRSEGDVCGF